MCLFSTSSAFFLPKTQSPTSLRKAAGGAEAQSHHWYFVDSANKEKGKICATCYKSKATLEKKESKRPREEEEEVTAGDTLVKIMKICEKRCVTEECWSLPWRIFRNSPSGSRARS